MSTFSMSSETNVETHENSNKQTNKLNKQQTTAKLLKWMATKYWVWYYQDVRFLIILLFHDIWSFTIHTIKYTCYWFNIANRKNYVPIHFWTTKKLNTKRFLHQFRFINTPKKKLFSNCKQEKKHWKSFHGKIFTKLKYKILFYKCFDILFVFYFFF